MRIQDQVTSVELSNKLHKLGITTPSIFYRDWTGAKENEIEMWGNNKSEYCPDNVNCYTVAELGEIMKGLDFKMPCYWNDKWEFERNDTEEFVRLDTEANARAEMLIYSLENGLIKKQIILTLK